MYRYVIVKILQYNNYYNYTSMRLGVSVNAWMGGLNN